MPAFARSQPATVLAGPLGCRAALIGRREVGLEACLQLRKRRCPDQPVGLRPSSDQRQQRNPLQAA